MTNYPQAVGRSQPFVKIQPPAIIGQRSPTSSDTNYVKGQLWLDESASPSVLYTYTGGGIWEHPVNTDDFATDAQAQAKTSTTTVLTPSNLAAEGFLQYADVTLTATQIKALATTPITLVAAQGAGTLIKFINSVFKLNYGSEVFAESGDNLGIKYTDASGVQVSQTIECTGFIDQSADTYTNAEPGINAIVAASAGENAALVLDNLGSNFTGNASDDSTLLIRTYYVVQSI